MKHPSEKQSNTGLVAGLIIGGVVAAGLAYLFFTGDGEEILAEWKQKVKEAAKDIGAGMVSGKTGISKEAVKKAADVAVNSIEDSNL